MEIELGKSIVDIVYQYGVVPVLLYWVYTLTNRVSALEVDIKKVNEDHKHDLKANGDDVKTLLQTVTKELMELRHKLPLIIL